MSEETPSHSLSSLVVIAFLILALLLSSLNGVAMIDATASSPPTIGTSITVTSGDLNGSMLSGFRVDLTINGNPAQSGFIPVAFNDLQTGVQYLVTVYWYGDYYFRPFSNGNLNRYELVTLNATSGQGSVTLKSLYQLVPPSLAASLNILAEFPNGTRIGTTFNNSGYIQHTWNV